MISAGNGKRTDDELFAEVLRRRAGGEETDAALGELCERWRQPALAVARQVQASYGLASPEEPADVVRDAERDLAAGGLAQYRGLAERSPSRSASPKAFFLCMVKHAAIGRCRQHRDEDAQPADAEAASSQQAVGASQTSERAAGRERETKTRRIYWAAFEQLRAEHPDEAAAWDLSRHRDVKSRDELARRLGVTLAEARRRVSRAQAYLKLSVLDADDEGGT